MITKFYFKSLLNFQEKASAYCLVLISVFFVNVNLHAQCLTAPNGQYPSTTFTPTCSGTNQVIVSDAFAGEYSLVNLTAGVTYIFSSSIATDYLTISTTAPAALAFGVTPVTYTPTTSGNFRFYTHTNSSCGSNITNRARRIRCNVTAPANDACTSPISLTVNSSCTTTSGTTVGATSTFGASLCSGGTSSSANDVFYSFIASNTAQTVTVVSSTDMVVQAISGTCAAPVSVACVDAVASGTETLSLTGLMVGTLYYIRVYGWNGASGTFTICVTGTCLAATSYAFTGGGAYCSGSTAPNVGLTNSQVGFSYQLKVNGTNTGSPVSGTGAAISFGAQGSAGTYTVMATNRGVSGCTNTLTTNTTISINSAPVFSACPSNIVTTTASGECTKQVTYTATATGTPSATLSYSFTGATVASGSGTGSGSTFNKGVTTVSIVAANSCSPAANCTFTVTVADNEQPLIVNLPTNIVASNDPAVCTAVVTWISPTATDNCPGVSIIQTAGPASGATFSAGTTTAISYTATDASGNTSTGTFTVKISDTENPLVTCPAPAVFCESISGNYTVGNASASDNCAVASISYVISGATSRSGTGNDASGVFTTGVSTITFTATDITGNTSNCSVTVTVRSVLSTPGSINGPTDVCPLVGSTTATSYSIAPVVGATFYTWTVPAGTTIVSGQGTTSLQVTFDNSFALTNSLFTVVASSDASCSSLPSTLEVLKIVPGIPVAINGPTDACSFIGQVSTASYSIDAVANATSYTWTVSGAATIVSGQGTTNIEINFAAGFTSGSVKVTANSNCGSRSARSLTVSKTLPVAPLAINGPSSACSFIGTSSTAVYSIAPVSNANSYFWTVPANVVIVSGQGTTDLSVRFSSGYNSGSIKVRAVANCGNSGDRSLIVTASTYTIPGAISGPVNACAFIGTNNEASYSIRQVLNATSYIWTVPAGAVIISHPGGLAETDTIITVAFNNNFVSGSTIAVQAAGCVPSASRTLAILRVLPTTPGLIAGSINACPFMQSASNPSGTSVFYTIRKVVNATGYNWNAAVGSTILSHPGGSGINDTIIEVNYSSAFVSGAVTVAATNACGTGTVRSLSIAKLNAGAPSQIDVIQLNSCPDRQYSYTLASLPNNAIGINWTIPNDAVLVSGQGSTSIIVSYPATSVTGNVTATPYNNCSSGTTRTVAVKIAACAVTEFARIGDKVEVLPALKLLQVNVFPNPSVNDFKILATSGSNMPVNIRILDLQGRQHQKLTVMPNRTSTLGSNLKAGSYIIEAKQGTSLIAVKMVKL